MSLFKPYSILLDIPQDKAQTVLEKITGEYGKLIRDNYELKPFTGTIKEKSFGIIPNHSSASIKIKGSVLAEGMNKTRLEVTGQIMLIKLILFLVVGLSVAGMLLALSFTIAVTSNPILGACTIFFPILIMWQLFYLIIGHPKSDYNDAVYQLMRKMDLHEYVL